MLKDWRPRWLILLTMAVEQGMCLLRMLLPLQCAFLAGVFPVLVRPIMAWADFSRFSGKIRPYETDQANYSDFRIRGA